LFLEQCTSERLLTAPSYFASAPLILALEGTSLPSRSTGGKVWPAALALCTYLSSHPECIQDKSVLEIGAGLGLCGILAGHYCKSVVLTDNDTEVLQVLGNNDERSKPKLRAQAIVRRLQWVKGVEAFKEEVREPFDVILASDVLYYPSAVELVWKTVDELLCKRKEEGREVPQFILSHVSRDKNVDKDLMRMAQERNFIPQVVPVYSLYKTGEDIPSNDFVTPDMLRLFIFVRGRV